MSAPKPYNGHHCWNCWNVSLWILNDDGLYRAALECKRRPLPFMGKVTPTVAALRFFGENPVGGGPNIYPGAVSRGERTPDGARYTFKAVRAVMAGLDE